MNVIQEVYSRVRRGAQFLDKIVPEWRKVLRRHAKHLELGNGEQCVLGTLEHYSKQMQNLNRKRLSADMTEADYSRAVERLNLVQEKAVHLGFDVRYQSGVPRDLVDYQALNAAWQAEIHS